jgi:tetratricopeptide (TPR) repeat protein
VTAFREALRRGPAVPDDHFGLGKSLLLVNELAGAVAALGDAVRLGPMRGDFHYEYASALHRNKQLPEALAATRQAVRIMPRAAPAHLLLGKILTDQGKPDEALPALQEAMRLRPSTGVAFLVGEALFGKGSVDEAVSYLTDPVEPLTDQTAEAYTALLVLHGKTGDYRTCCAAILKRYRRTLQAAEAFWIARCLALAPDAGTDPALAVRLAERSLQASPMCGWYLNALALAHYRAGQVDQAVRRAEEALKVAPRWHPPLSALVLALAHQRLGHRGEAQRWLVQAKQAGKSRDWINPLDRVLYQCLLREAEAAGKKQASPK